MMSIAVPYQHQVVMKRFLKLSHALLIVLTISLIVGLASCRDRGFLTPATQNFAATLNSWAAEQEPRYSYDGRYIVFTSDRQAQRSIYLYDVIARRLIDLPGLNQPSSFQEQPDISADARYIVYISEQLGKPDVFVYDRQTLQAEPITENILAEFRHPTISGNGRFIAFESNRTGQWDIEIYDQGADVEFSLPTDSVPTVPKSPSNPATPATPATKR